LVRYASGDSPSREEVLEWLRAKIEELELELKFLKGILALLDSSQQVLVGERVEDVKIGRRRVARLHVGEGYVRVTFESPIVLPSEVREYLRSVEEDLRVLQAKSGAEGELARLVVREKPDGSVAEVRLENLQSAIEVIKAKAALKYSVEITYQLLKAREKELESIEAD